MRRTERAQLLERLCDLKALYAMRGDDDRTSVMSIANAETWASNCLGEEPAGSATPLPGRQAA